MLSELRHEMEQHVILNYNTNLFKTSVKLPPQSRFRKRPSAQGLPSHSSSPPVTMPGTKTTGWRAVKPSSLSLVPGDSRTWKPGNVAGMQLNKTKRSHQVVHKYPIAQQHEFIQLHSFGCLLFLFSFFSKAVLASVATVSSFLSIFWGWKDSNFTGST